MALTASYVTKYSPYVGESLITPPEADGMSRADMHEAYANKGGLFNH